MTKKMTAVEWLEDEINKVLLHLPIERDEVKILIQQAKQMEKEQIGRELSESERYTMFEDRGYEFRMNDWTREEQYDKAGIPKRTREPYPLPKLFFKYEKETYIDNYELDGFILKDYQSHPTIKAPLSN